MNSLFEVSDTPHWQLPGFQRTFRPGELTFGLTLPIEEDAEENPLDSLDNQLRLIRKAEAGGVAAIWVRDIPLRVETFGDVGQVYDPWMYLSYIAAYTSSIALGTAAIVVPFQHPLLTAKRAGTIDRLSGGRFLMGVATGDRPEEFPAFGQDKGKRDEEFRERIAAYRRATLTTHTPCSRVRPFRDAVPLSATHVVASAGRRTALAKIRAGSWTSPSTSARAEQK